MFFLRHCSDWCRHWSNKWLLHTRLLHTVCLFSALSLVDCRIKTKIINLESNCSLWSRHLPQCVKSGKNHVHKVKKWDRNQVENWCADLYDQRRANICWDRCALLLWALRPLNMGSKVPGFWTAAGMEAAALFQRPLRIDAMLQMRAAIMRFAPAVNSKVRKVN